MIRLRRSENGSRGRDDGFSLAETLIALTLITVTMSAAAPFFIKSVVTVVGQRGNQAAVELADSALEQVRALKGTSLLTGRSAAASAAQWNSAPAAIKPYLLSMKQASDPLITSGSSTLGADAAISTSPQTMTVQQVTYTRSIYLGTCDIFIGLNASCLDPAQVPNAPIDTWKDMKFFRVVVLVTWPDRNCALGQCSYVTSTLIARSSEPTFDFHRPPPIIDQFAYTFYRNVAGSAQLSATGGQLPNTWTSTTVPAGMSLSPAGVLSGTPTTAGVVTASVTIKDSLGRTDIETVTFTITTPPSLSAPASARNHVNETVSTTLTTTGGKSPYIYTVTGLPAGLTLDKNTGVISGTVTTAGVYNIVATSTDAANGTSTKSWTHTVYPELSLNTIPDQSITLGQVFTATAAGAGGDNTYTYAATGLPGGVLMNATTGVMTGLPTISGRYLPLVTVTDGLGASVSQRFVLLVNTSSSLIWTTPSFTAADQTATVGTPTSVTFKNNGSVLGLNPTMSGTGMPPGVTFNPLTGTASGTPTKAGTYPVTVTAVSLLPPQTTSYTFLWTVK